MNMIQTAAKHLPLDPEQMPRGSGQEFSRKKIMENAHEYTSFLMSTFAKVMLETSKVSNITIDEDIMGNALLGDALGEALVESGAGEIIRQDLLSEMLEMQGLEKRKPSAAQNTFLIQKAFAKAEQGGSHASS